MLVVVGLWIAGAVVTAAAPLVLRTGVWQVRRPRVALTAWVMMFGVGCGAFLASVPVAVGYAVSEGAAAGPVAATVAMVAAWVLLGLVGGATALVANRAAGWNSGLPTVRAQLTALRAGACTHTWRVSGYPVDVIDVDEPIALSLRDTGVARVIVSGGLVAAVDAAQLRAIIQHECAHLRWRHDRVAATASLAHAVLPGLPAGRRFTRAARLLIELAADDEAARVCGAGVCADALDRLGELTGAAGMVVRADRVRRLASRTGRRPGVVPSAGRSRALSRHGVH